LYPEAVATLRARQVIAPLHLREHGPKIVRDGAVHQLIESGDPGGTPDEYLNSAWIARNVRLALFGRLDLARANTDRAGKHPFFSQSCHFQNLNTSREG
jgi:hypothetical protein